MNTTVAPALLSVLYNVQNEDEATLCIRGSYDASWRIEIQHVSGGLHSYRMPGNDYLFPLTVADDDALIIVVYRADNSPAVCGHYTVQLAGLAYGCLLDGEIYNTLIIDQQDAASAGVVASVETFLTGMKVVLWAR